jgi:succinoglycan biosynthesis transport protein ExoP
MSDAFDFDILMRRKRRILMAGIIMSCLALAVSLVLPRQFVAEGGMIVENSEPNVPELGMGIGSADGVVLTQVEVLRSRELIKSVVVERNLAEAPDLMPAMRLPVSSAVFSATIKRFETTLAALVSGNTATATIDRSPVDRATDYVQKNLKVDATEHSSVISLRFQAGSPKLAVDVVNTVMSTYLSGEVALRHAQIASVNGWLSDHARSLKREADEANAAVERFVKSHVQPEVQGSPTTYLQLTKDEEQLSLAEQSLAKHQAILDSVVNGGGTSAPATLESRTIQDYRSREAQLVQQISLMAPNDPRRAPLEHALAIVHTQIATEIDRIVAGMRHNVEVARADVVAMQRATDRDLSKSQISTDDAATLATLHHDAEAKREMYIAFGARSERTFLAGAELPSARILSPAALEPTNSTSALALVLGFVAGVLGACAVIVLRESFNRQINSASKMALITGLPVCGSLPAVKNTPQLLGAPAASIVGETLRGIWFRLRPTASNGEGTTILVTSSDAGEGKTTVAAALARRIAEDGFRVLLIDADLRRPSLAAALGTKTTLQPPDPGKCLEAVLIGAVTLQRAAGNDPRSGIDYLLADGTAMIPMTVLASERFSTLLNEAKAMYDFVVLDSPPVLQVTDAVIMARHCDHILFIVRADYVAAELVSEATRRFHEPDRSKIVTLLTGVRPGDLNRGDYFGGYHVA